MSTLNRIRRGWRVPLFAALAWLAAAVSAPSYAQLTIDVTTSAGRQVPIAIVPFANEANAPQNITPLIAGNLSRTGLFRIVNTGGISRFNDVSEETRLGSLFTDDTGVTELWANVTTDRFQYS